MRPVKRLWWHPIHTAFWALPKPVRHFFAAGLFLVLGAVIMAIAALGGAWEGLKVFWYDVREASRELMTTWQNYRRQ